MRIERLIFPAIRAVGSKPWLANLVFARDKWGSPLDPDTLADPYPVLERMRTDGPIVHRRIYQQWFVFGYDEARQVLSSDAVASANQIEILLEVSPYRKLSDRSKRFFTDFLIFLDPPDHTRLRRLVNRAFTPARVRDLEQRTVDLVAELLDDAVAEADGGPFDLVPALATPLPVNVIGTLLGLPRERWEWSRRTTAEIVKFLDPFRGFDARTMDAIVDDLFDYYGSLADQRRIDPQPDLITALVEAEDDGDRLSRDELIAMIALLAGAGHETTTHLLGLATLALERHPDQRRLVRDDPSLWPNAVEELVRYDSSVRSDPRHTLRDLTVGDTTIPAGSNVLIQFGAVNRDPRVYDRPNELILDRPDPNPLSFGHGVHHCLGAALARMELRAGLQAIVERFGDYTVDPDSLRWKQSATLRGPERLVLIPG